MKVHCFYNCGATELTPSAMEAHYLKHHTKLRPYYGLEFTCDNCQKYWTSSPLYSPARNSQELKTKPHYCGKCVNKLQSPPKLSPLKPKNMNKKLTKKRKLTKSKLKPKRTLKSKASKKTKSTALTLTKSRSKVKNTPAYYNCLLNQAKSGFKGKITKACQACKTNAPALNLAYKKEAQKLIGAYKQLGVSLSKILSH